MVPIPLLIGALAGVGIALVRRGLAAKKRSLYEQQTGVAASTILLKRSPNRLKGADLLFLAAAILAKYIPGTPGFGVGLKRAKGDDQRFTLEHIDVEGPLQIDEDDVTRFSKAVADATCNPIFAVALTAPLIIFILSLHACPVKPLGAVNTRNVFHFLQPDLCRDAKTLLQASRAGKLRFRASFGGAERAGIRRKRGMEFAIHIDLMDEAGQSILRQELYFLQFLKSSVQPRYMEETTATEAGASNMNNFPATLNTTDLPRLATNAPRAWAASCGDYNPIHISALAAKLFGFPSVIAHGNHVVALAVQSLHGAKDCTPMRVLFTEKKAFHLDVRFVKPMLLPAQLQAAWSVPGEGDQPPQFSSCQLSVRGRHDKVHILGTLDQH